MGGKRKELSPENAVIETDNINRQGGRYRSETTLPLALYLRSELHYQQELG